MSKPPASTHVLPGNPPVTVDVRRTTRAKHYYLRVSRADGRVSLSVPVWASEAEALAFLHGRAPWVRRQLSKTARAEIACIGAEFPIEGVGRPIVAGTGRAARFEDGAIHVPNDLRQGTRIKALLKAMARDRVTPAVEAYAARLGRPFGKITLRDTKSRWGSCTDRGDLMFSWRLIMAPPAVLDYVAAHEVAHLVEMNHSPAYWAVCARLCPDFMAHRRWLRQHGAGLLAWRFEPDGRAPE